MEYVDYQKLAEQYASFLVAIGGVSITVLVLVLSLRPDSAESPQPTEGDSRSFLATALVLAALSCFVGAQMMTETAAFINATNDDADRLFLLASSNIFIAIVLVFFALIFLPLASGKAYLASIKPIAILFFLIVAGALYWAALAGLYRMHVPESESAIWGAAFIGLVWCGILYCLTISKKFRTRTKNRFEIPPKWWLWAAFTPSALLTVVSLAWFAWIFKDGNSTTLRKATLEEVKFFGLSIALSHGSLVMAGIKTMIGNQLTDNQQRTPEQNDPCIKAMLHLSE